MNNPQLRLLLRETRPLRREFLQLLWHMLPWVPLFIGASVLTMNDLWLLRQLGLPVEMGFFTGPLIILVALIYRKVLRG